MRQQATYPTLGDSLAVELPALDRIQVPQPSNEKQSVSAPDPGAPGLAVPTMLPQYRNHPAQTRPKLGAITSQENEASTTTAAPALELLLGSAPALVANTNSEESSSRRT